ncbi:hypothetical protein KEM48_009484 [Puccinia striiformis f. sp. tritici PST-130]|nr:hypothetical protein KEM48_009484 [Puccinia striiformis f. sp. tritici PST-130]
MASQQKQQRCSASARFSLYPAKMTPNASWKFFSSLQTLNCLLAPTLGPPIGLPSTMRLMPLLRNEVHRTKGGYDLWSSFIQRAINILVSQERKGYYPRGSFHSSLSVKIYSLLKQHNGSKR